YDTGPPRSEHNHGDPRRGGPTPPPPPQHPAVNGGPTPLRGKPRERGSGARHRGFPIKRSFAAIPDQSCGITCPSSRPTMSCHVARLTLNFTDRTEPSPKTTLNPLECAEPKKSHIPHSRQFPDGSRQGRLRAVASWIAGLSFPGWRFECRALIQVEPFAQELLSPHCPPPYRSVETYFSPTSTVFDVPSVIAAKLMTGSWVHGLAKQISAGMTVPLESGKKVGALAAPGNPGAPQYAVEMECFG